MIRWNNNSSSLVFLPNSLPGSRNGKQSIELSDRQSSETKPANRDHVLLTTNYKMKGIMKNKLSGVATDAHAFSYLAVFYMFLLTFPDLSNAQTPFTLTF